MTCKPLFIQIKNFVISLKIYFRYFVKSLSKIKKAYETCVS